MQQANMGIVYHHMVMLYLLFFISSPGPCFFFILVFMLSFAFCTIGAFLSFVSCIPSLYSVFNLTFPFPLQVHLCTAATVSALCFLVSLIKGLLVFLIRLSPVQFWPDSLDQSPG